jgi:uncharacterized protein (DUF1778 family)
MGRPKLDKTKDKSILIRVTNEQRDKFKKKADELGYKKVSQLIMSLIG